MDARVVSLFVWWIFFGLVAVSADSASAAPIIRTLVLDPPPDPPLVDPPYGLEGCNFVDGCETVVPTGVLVFESDLMLGEATIDLSGVEATALLTSPAVPAVEILFALERVTGRLVGISALTEIFWAFDVQLNSGREVEVTVVDRTRIGLLPELTIFGGFDLTPVDGPSAQVNVSARPVPEPGMAVLTFTGLVLVARGRRGGRPLRLAI